MQTNHRTDVISYYALYPSAVEILFLIGQDVLISFL